MSPKNKIKKEGDSEQGEERYPLFEAARKVLLASIGAIALAQGEVEQFVNKLVERGEIAEKDGKKLIQEIIEKRKEKLGKAEEKISKRVESIFKSMNVPTRKEIDELAQKISSLSQQIDEIKKPKE
jgi:poly(hydroxyalkanoate) granule-associated protein